MRTLGQRTVVYILSALALAVIVVIVLVGGSAR